MNSVTNKQFWWDTGVRFPAEALHSVQTRSRAQPASYPLEAWRETPSSNEARNVSSYIQNINSRGNV
jgi:hypothetical protein